MNLHGLASTAVSAVNPNVFVTLSQSTGYATNAAGARTATYTTLQALAQVQALSGPELRQVDALNIQGVKRKIWLNGDWEGVVRAMMKGGDKLTLPDGTTWLFVLIFEHWPDWTSAAIVQQTAP